MVVTAPAAGLDERAVRIVLDELDVRMRRQVRGLWHGAADLGLSGPGFQDLVAVGYPQVVTPYSVAAAELGAHWYDEAPTTSRGFDVRTAEPAPIERLERSARWAMETTRGLEGLELLLGSATRALFDGLRDTVELNAAAEPGATWARYASATACGFCRLLAIRGADYTSESAATTVVGRRGRSQGGQKLGASFHDNCRCMAVMVRPGQTWEPPAYYEQWQADARAAVEGGAVTPGEITAAMDRAPGGRRDPARTAAAGKRAPATAGGTGGGGGKPPRPPSGPTKDTGGLPDDEQSRRLTAETAEWAAGLSDNDLRTISRWQHDDRFYEQVQRAVAGHPASEEAQRVAEQLTESVITHPLDGEYVGWRGIRSSQRAFGVRSDDLESMIGDEGRISRFNAASLDKNVAEEEFTRPELDGGAALVRVHYAPGTRVAWVAPVGDPQFAYQQELLPHPATWQRIVGVDRSGRLPVVEMEVYPGE